MVSALLRVCVFNVICMFGAMLMARGDWLVGYDGSCPLALVAQSTV